MSSVFVWEDREVPSFVELQKLKEFRKKLEQIMKNNRKHSKNKTTLLLQNISDDFENEYRKKFDIAQGKLLISQCSNRELTKKIVKNTKEIDDIIATQRERIHAREEKHVSMHDEEIEELEKDFEQKRRELKKLKEEETIMKRELKLKDKIIKKNTEILEWKRMENEFNELTELDNQLSQTESTLKKMKWPLKEVLTMSPKPKKTKSAMPKSQAKPNKKQKKTLM